MEQLKVIDIYNLVDRLQKQKKMNLIDIMNLPIYLGNDDELNNIHCGWYCEMIENKKGNSLDDKYIIDLINCDNHNIKLEEEKKAILIS